MQPKTKLQHRVEELAPKLKPLSEEQKSWVYANVFSKDGQMKESTGHVYCSCCGATFRPKDKKHRCPNCGTKLEFKKVYYIQKKENVYCTLLDTCKEFQVVRHFIAERRTYKTKPNVYNLYECIQHWISPNGNDTVRSVERVIFSYDIWICGSPFQLRRCNERHIVNSWIIPYGKLTELVRRNGASIPLFKKYLAAPEMIMQSILRDNRIEMLLKTGQLNLMAYAVKTDRVPYLHAIKVCNRNHYIVEDASMWYDYISMLEEMGYDTHNAHYVCPDNLSEAHDDLLRKKRKKRDAKELKRRIEESVIYERQYKERMGKFFGLVIANEDIVIKPLTSVLEFAKEGTAMHHCVFDCKYFLKKDSLILSAKDKKGNRLETIEYDLKNKQVIQSRSYSNGVSPEHRKIIKLMKTADIKINRCIFA